MAGTAYIRSYCSLVDLGHVPPLNRDFSITGVDEYVSNYLEIATVTEAEILRTGVNTVTGVYIYLVSGGTTAATGLSIDISTTSNWVASDIVLVSGQAIFFVPTHATPATDMTWVKNLNSSTCTIEYLTFGDNA